MAVIFYYSEDRVDPATGEVIDSAGDIYGVHPDRNITVPDEVASISVSGKPDKIGWPALPDGSPGNEHTSRIDLAAKALVVDAAAIPPPDPSDELEAALDALDPVTATVEELIAVLRGQAGKKGRIVGRPL